MTHVMIPFIFLSALIVALVIAWFIFKVFVKTQVVHTGFLIAAVILFLLTGAAFVSSAGMMPVFEADYYASILTEENYIRDKLSFYPDLGTAARVVYKKRLIKLFDKQLHEELYMTYNDWKAFHTKYYPDGREKKVEGLTEDEFKEYLNILARNSKLKDEIIQYRDENR